jgi:hypothetical protein
VCGTAPDRRCVWDSTRQTRDVCGTAPDKRCVWDSTRQEMCVGQHQTGDVCGTAPDRQEMCVGQHQTEDVCGTAPDRQEMCVGQHQTRDVCGTAPEKRYVWDSTRQEMGVGQHQTDKRCVWDSTRQECWLGSSHPWNMNRIYVWEYYRLRNFHILWHSPHFVKLIEVRVRVSENVHVGNCDRKNWVENTQVGIILKLWIDVHISVHHKYISEVQPTRCNVFSIYLFLQIALHVSGVSSAHHQEHKTLHTASGIVKPILLLS